MDTPAESPGGHNAQHFHQLYRPPTGQEIARALSRNLSTQRSRGFPFPSPVENNLDDVVEKGWVDPTAANTESNRQNAASSREQIRPGRGILRPSRRRSEPNVDGLNDLSGQENAGEPTDAVITDSRMFRRMPKSKAWALYFGQEIAGDKYLEFQLLMMTIGTGMLDAITNSTYGVFTSKMTGNTLALATYTFSHPPGIGRNIVQNVGVAMGVYVAGAIFFGHIGHITTQRRRAWLLASQLFQAMLMLSAAGVRYWVSRKRDGAGALAILALCAFAESGQVSTALNVNMPELNTTMITGALILLVTDKNFFKPYNPKRNRRALFFLSYLVGSYAGEGALNISTPTVVLIVVAVYKCVLVISFLFNRGMVQRRTISGDGTPKVSGTATPASRVLWGD